MGGLKLDKPARKLLLYIINIIIIIIIIILANYGWWAGGNQVSDERGWAWKIVLAPQAK
jgi:uncharacterized protein YpmB